MAYLLDVNVLIALIDPAHIHHQLSHDWFSTSGHEAWATCPITENGVVRIVGHPRYANFSGSPAEVVRMMAQLRALPGHRFWPDDISLTDTRWFDQDRLLSSGQVTDSYLLGLARAHGGQLATLDRRLLSDAVAGGADALHLIE